MNIIEFMLENKAPIVTILLAVLGVILLLFHFVQFRFKEMKERIDRVDQRSNKILDKVIDK
jgi:c-di-AMP phosphodiesterase-like protein